MSDLNEQLKRRIKNCNNLKDLTYASIASFCGCSADKVRRRVSDEVKQRKEEIRKASIKPKRKIKDKSSSGCIDSIVKRLEKIESNIEVIKSELSSKDKPNPWFDHLCHTTPKDQLVDIKVNGSILTMEYEETYNYVCHSEFIDREINKIESQVDRGWLTEEQCEEEIKELNNAPIDIDHYTEIRISNRQSSQLEKKLNRIIRALNA